MFYYVAHIQHVNNIHWNTHWKTVLIKKPNYILHPLCYPCLVANCLDMSILPTELNVIHNLRGFWNSCNRMFSDKAFMVTWQSSVVLYLHFVNIYIHTNIAPAQSRALLNSIAANWKCPSSIINNTHLVPQTLNTSKWKGRKLEVKNPFFLHCPRAVGWWNFSIMTTRSFSILWHLRFWSGRIAAAGPLRHQVSITKECCFPRIPSQNSKGNSTVPMVLTQRAVLWFLSTRALQWLSGSQFLWSRTKHLQIYSEQVVLFTTKYTIC